jgi:SsrA-binding protein
MAKAKGEKPIVDNRRARHDYHLSDKVEAGLVLTGTEVKALRDGKATLQQAYADVRGGEAWLVGLHIPEYGQGNRSNHEPDRARKLLLHRREIDRMYAQVREKGMTIVPTKLYFKDGRVKASSRSAKARISATSAATSPSGTRSGTSSGPSRAGRDPPTSRSSARMGSNEQRGRPGFDVVDTSV